jgi:peptide chain release factor 3
VTQRALRIELPATNPAEAHAVSDDDPATAEVLREARRRRTFAVISHPDAGKSTLTEALALHARAISEAGAVHGKAGRRGVTSDFMEMEKTRGISISSAVLQFEYRDTVINLLDTPGHADFSEDTYRVLAAVDGAVMLLDAAKGLEPQTLKLFDVCRHRRLPVITFVNKWDRPGRESLELLDEIEQRIGLRATPLTWPVGIAGDFRGVIDRQRGEYTRFHRTPGGATIAEEQRVPAEQAAVEEGEAWRHAVEEVDLLRGIGAEPDLPTYYAGTSTPVLFGAALPNFGVRRLLDTMVDLAPPPTDRADEDDQPRPVHAPFAGQVFKVQAGANRAHRDRVAFVRVCSGRFERGMVVTHAQTGKPFTTKYAHAAFGQDRHTVETCYPGDIVGLVNASALRVGDTLYAEQPVAFPAIPSFAPEHFAVVRAVDFSRFKQFRRGMAQLAEEGVVQVLYSDLRGEQAPVLAAVGPMQFDVVTHRLEHEYGAAARLEHLAYTLARRTEPTSSERLTRASGIEVLTRITDGALLALFPNRWRLHAIAELDPDLVLEPLVAAEPA